MKNRERSSSTTGRSKLGLALAGALLALAGAACSLAPAAGPTSPAGSPATLAQVAAATATVAPTTAEPTATATATRTPRPTATPIPTITLTPTATSTDTPDPAVYDPATFGDTRLLASFVVRTAAKQAGQNYLREDQKTTEYNRDPALAHQSRSGRLNYSISDSTASDEYYWLGEWNYSKNNLTGQWWVNKPDPQSVYYDVKPFDMEGNNLHMGGGLYFFDSATYVGVEAYQGIPAYHYTFDETNVNEIETGDWEIDRAEGELFVSVEGRFPLFIYGRFFGKVIWDQAGSGTNLEGVVEWSQELISFNQPVEISLPPDYPDPDLDLDLPLPPGSTLSGFTQRPDGVKWYEYSTPVDQEGYNAFYAALGSVNGWSAPAPATVHNGELLWCDECVSLSKGGERAILEFRNMQIGFGANDFLVTIRVFFGLL